jgi:hypothetical protein
VISLPTVGMAAQREDTYLVGATYLPFPPTPPDVRKEIRGCGPPVICAPQLRYEATLEQRATRRIGLAASTTFALPQRQSTRRQSTDEGGTADDHLDNRTRSLPKLSTV